MFNRMTDYMHIKEYKFAYNVEDMVKKFLNSNCCKKLSTCTKMELITKLPTYVNRLDWGYVRYNNDKKPSRKEINLGKDMLKNIKDFLKENNNVTRSKKLRRTGTRRR